MNVMCNTQVVELATYIRVKNVLFERITCDDEQLQSCITILLLVIDNQALKCTFDRADQGSEQSSLAFRVTVRSSGKLDEKCLERCMHALSTDAAKKVSYTIFLCLQLLETQFKR